MATWSENLPAPLRVITVNAGSNLYRQEWASGRAENRLFGTNDPDTVKLQLRLSKDKIPVFEDWYNRTANFGINWFTASWLSDLGYTNHKARLIGYPQLKGLTTSYADYTMSILVQESVYCPEDTFWSTGSTGTPPAHGMVVATGGTITHASGNRIHTFLASGNFTVQSGDGDVDFVVIAGGGGGAGRYYYGCGGGGAGGFRKWVTGELNNTEPGAYTVTPGVYPVIIGLGGAGAYGGSTSNPNPEDYGEKGGDSSIFGVVVLGGGAGTTTASQMALYGNGGSGGAGSGRSSSSINWVGGDGAAGQGNDGGDGFRSGVRYGGGGGGAGEAGETATSGIGCGDGGDGLPTSITGSEVYYCAGGGGGSYTGSRGLGGLGGGGNGGARSGDIIASNASNYGSGGGGGGGDWTPDGSADGGNGYQGIVFVRYVAPPSIVATGGTITQVGNYKVHTFTASGTFTVTESSDIVDFLIVGGGGSGGYQSGVGSGGGGGAGAVVKHVSGESNNLQAVPYYSGVDSYEVIVGSGGANPTIGNAGNNGGNSSVFGFTALGGGGGGVYGTPGRDGGCGGGGGVRVSSGVSSGGIGSPGYSGIAGWGTGTHKGGGGGGAGENGNSQIGGAGIQSSITGVSSYYGGGGGGGSNFATATGGNGGGGRGAYSVLPIVDAVAGTDGTGGGGGGSSTSSNYTRQAAAGGSGIVIVRYYSP